MDSPQLTRTIDAAVPADSSALIGGKGAGLAQILRLGLRSAPAFAITVDAFWSYVASLSLERQIERLNAQLAGDALDPELAAEIRSRMLGGDVSANVLDEIRERRQRFPDAGGGAVPVMVRSSATVEDSASHSYAGIFESVPVGREQSLQDALKRVWASVFSPRAIAYYRLARLEHVPAMAIVVQALIEAERSGVMFTRFVTGEGDERVLIEHVEGAGEKLVAGTVDPQRLWVKRWPKDVSAITDPAGTGGLVATLALSLASAGRLLEERLGCPQDVEWCVADDALFIVQARPITGVAKTAAQRFDEGGDTPALHGVAASGGRASGRVHLVFNIEDADALARSRILVTTMTNPDMVTAMSRSSAIVTDVGGMICHAAIVSRELSIPCVVGTGQATTLLRADDEITVDGSAGAVYRGLMREASSRAANPPPSWTDLWGEWLLGRREEDVPLLSTIAALEAAALPLAECVLTAWPDLAMDEQLHPVWLAGSSREALRNGVSGYLERASRAARARGIGRIFIDTSYLAAAHAALLEEVARSSPELVVLPACNADARTSEAIATSTPASGDLPRLPGNARAVPLAAAALRESRTGMRAGPATMAGGVFGRAPECRMSPMPDSCRRALYREFIPALAQSHGTHGADDPKAMFEWLDLRPEVPITPMLKSLVLAGMETVPAAMGFADLRPMYVKWIRCRFHFRKDTFFALWGRLSAAAWDEPFMSRLLSRTRETYRGLERAAAEFPAAAEDWQRASAGDLRRTFVPWWHAFVDFFSQSFFIQALGDDHMYPAVRDCVTRNAALFEHAGSHPNYAIPGVEALTAPTTPVLTAQYLADLVALGNALAKEGCTSVDDALERMSRPSTGDIGALVQEHLRRWHWMRERDPYYAPYDRPEVVLAKALDARASSSPVPDYAENARRGRLALSFHFDLCRYLGGAEKLAYATAYGHGLALDREDHHIVWLKCSYPFRELCLEWERRLARFVDLREGDIFFMEAPEALAAIDALPQACGAEFLERVRNRRRAYETELRLKRGQEVATRAQEEDDYY